MRNSTQAKYKYSKMELMTNKLIMLVLATQLILGLIGALIGATWNTGEGENAMYLGNTTDSEMGYWDYVIRLTGTWILIFTNFVPISLMVTLEVVKFWQAGFMTVDYMMFDEEQDMKMRAQASNLNEELGQVEYVFSDKTGTLTCNIMEFKKMSAGDQSYGTGDKPDKPQLSNVNFHDPVLENIDSSDPNYMEVNKAMYFLALCHSIVIDEKKGTYNAASPDELALVNFAKQLGYEFKGFDRDENMIIDIKG